MIKNDKILELERASEAELPNFATSVQGSCACNFTVHVICARCYRDQWVHFLVEKKFKRHVSFMNKLIRLAFYL